MQAIADVEFHNKHKINKRRLTYKVPYNRSMKVQSTKVQNTS